ncbi:MAG: HAD family hydrolase [Chloroflexota bacterium]|nr:MAG: HAD family hydrolase [Chloroflexota bacterium]
MHPETVQPDRFHRRVDAVIFDLGNTLIYFDGDWPEVIRESDSQLLHQLHSAGIMVDAESFISQFQERIEAYYLEREAEFIEYTTAYLLKELLKELGHPDLPDPIVRQALDAMYAVSQRHWRVEADAIPTLDILKQQGYRLGLISNAGDDHDVQTLIDIAGVRSYFDFIVSSAAVGIRKPNPAIFLMAAAQMGVKPSRCAMVGDRLGADVLGAHNAGMHAILITRRAESAANRAHQDTIIPDLVIATLAELPAKLENT